MSIKSADLKQRNFATELKNFKKGTERLENTSLLKNLGLLFSGREKVLSFDSLNSRLFPIKNLDKISTRQSTPELAVEQTPELAAEPTLKHQLKTRNLN